MIWAKQQSNPTLTVKNLLVEYLRKRILIKDDTFALYPDCMYHSSELGPFIFANQPDDGLVNVLSR